MSEVKLFDSERKVMEILWKEGDLPAGQIARILKEKVGWNRNTTYTVIKKCIAKNAVERYEPNFMCHAVFTQEEDRQTETTEFINKVYEGSKEQFFAAFLGNGMLSQEEISKLKKIVEDLK